jgi:DNA-binding GntR family transcriptional regulator
VSDTDFTVRRFSDDFAKLLRGRILGGDLQPGERLNEVHLAERYGISRSPIREALHALSSEGLVTFVPGKGAFVQELTALEVQYLGDVREALETQAARLVAQRGTASDFDELERAALITNAGGSDGPSEFHIVMLRLCGNPRLELIGVSTTTRLRLARARSASDTARLEVANDEHLEIVAAIRARDADLAGELTRRHIQLATLSAAEKSL